YRETENAATHHPTIQSAVHPTTAHTSAPAGHHHKNTVPPGIYGLMIIIMLLSLFNVWQLYSLNQNFAEKGPAAAVKVPQISLALITVESCPECSNLQEFIGEIEKSGVNITEKVTLDYSVESTKLLVQKYKIERLPALIIKGEVNESQKLSSLLEPLAVLKEGGYVIPALQPPYLELPSGNVKGKVTLTYLTKEDCLTCSNLTMLITLLKEQLQVAKFEEVSIGSEQGKFLVNNYNITKVPTLIFSKDAFLYPVISSVWNNVGSMEADGTLVMRNVNPPYFDLEKGKVSGLVIITVIKDSGCTECYNATQNKLILEQFGLVFDKVKELDYTLAEAQGLIAKHKITKIPTIILTGDTDIYPSLAQVWKDVGSVESDGSYVFRKVEVFGQPYRDLEQGKIITPEKK
ncbi:MAG: hypothetical protein AABY26_00740, partial [Nanoarchaeota archaeon]